MTVEESIVSLLSASADLTAKVGKAIRPLAFTQLEQRTDGSIKPRVAYRMETDETFPTFAGNADWTRVRFDLDIYANSYAECKAVATLCRSVLHNYSGLLEGIELGFVKHKDDTDLTEPPDLGVEKVIHRLASNYLILYREG